MSYKEREKNYQNRIAKDEETYRVHIIQRKRKNYQYPITKQEKTFDLYHKREREREKKRERTKYQLQTDEEIYWRETKSDQHRVRKEEEKYWAYTRERQKNDEYLNIKEEETR